MQIIPSVSGSFRNTSKQSIKFVPLKGSPPIPVVKIKKKDHCTTHEETWRRTVERELREQGLRTWSEAVTATEDKAAWGERGSSPILLKETKEQ